MAPAYQTVVQRFYGCQVTINYGAGVGFFSTKQQLKSERSLPVPVPYLTLWLRFTTAVTAKTVISKLLALNYLLFAFNGLNW